MKKSKYISKYDYIAFYTKQENFWFKTNAEIISEIESIKNQYGYYSELYEDDDEDDDFFDDGEISEFDAYEKYKELLEENKDVDKDNPLLKEGSILDIESKKFIKNKFIDIPWFDFDDIKYKNKTMEELAIETEFILKNHDSVIIFQPVFIHNNLITKCDAFVKIDSYDFHLIETKGTTTAKFHHYLDLFFQKQVIESKDYLKEKNISYELCLIKYEYKNKYEVSFETTKYINISKSPPSLSKAEKELPKNKIIWVKNKRKKGYYFDKIGEEHGILISNILCGDYSDIENKKILLNNTNTTKSLDKSLSILKDTYNNFNNVVAQLWDHKKNLENLEKKIKNNEDFKSFSNIKPSFNDKGPFKNDDNWPELRKLYSLQGYTLYDYSGKVAVQDEYNIKNAVINQNPKTFLKTPEKNPNIYIDAFINSNEEIQIDLTKTYELYNKLKNVKKVYFDFETINTSIRSCDNTLPFSQIVTQCSVIKDNGDGTESSPCENLIIDPTKIDVDWFKKVVDSIYYETTNEDEKVLYIVYNKSFEQTRLKEIAGYISDKNYNHKIIQIINNTFDLADFFTFTTNKKYIVFKELCGFYSIKKVLPLIKKYNPEIFDKTHCLDYNSLNVKNGKECQGETNKRFFLLISDSEWKKIEENLKVYCENDVRAMIAIEYFVKDLLEKYNK